MEADTILLSIMSILLTAQLGSQFYFIKMSIANNSDIQTIKAVCEVKHGKLGG